MPELIDVSARQLCITQLEYVHHHNFTHFRLTIRFEVGLRFNKWLTRRQQRSEGEECFHLETFGS